MSPGEEPLKYHVRLIVTKHATAGKATIFKSIDSIHDNSLGIKNVRQQYGTQALKGASTTLISMAT